MRKKLITLILSVVLALCLIFLGVLIYTLIPKECEHHFCDKTLIAPTCGEKGYTLYKCRACDYTFEADFVAPVGHLYTNEITEPTCDSHGFTTHTCSACGIIEIDGYVVAKGHDFTEEIVLPTCEAQGYTVNSCKSCDYKYVNHYVDPKGHSIEKVRVVPPTCDKNGYTEYECVSCDYKYASDYVAALGHSYTGTKTAPDCTNKGYTTYKCDNCDYSYVSDYVKPTGHDLKSTETEPSCTQRGYTTYSCKKCEYSYVSDFTPLTEHTLTKTTVAPTCTARGYSTYRCSDCTYTYTGDYVAPLEHELSSEVTAPTCTEEGYTTYSCENCIYTYVSDITAPEEHTYKRTHVRPNIEQTGYTIYECIVCGDKHISDYVFYSDIFSGSAGTGEGSLAFGVDVSHHSYDVDFEALRAAGVDFVILRVGYNTALDTRFEEYYEAAREAGLDIGVYFFTLAESKEDAEADARRVAGWLEGKTFEYPIFYDVEDDPNYSGYMPSTFSEAQMMEIAHTFMTEMVKYGYYPGLYTNNNFLYNVFNNEKTLRLYDVWYARYTTPTEELIDEYSGLYSMWQFEGNVNSYENGAVSGMCDLNYAFKDYPTIIKQFGFNGYD